eukprot:TRINITY_DN2832_c0_g2_i1.p1 TRINITY_DN2832_c0_g2~~TRINITY_DN2832_c0_g2_i1.p1  ORF type:complete len:370 (+),score=54.08 TRINITY_DN2832_c0_g2_i1:9-1118(+)
MDDFNLDDNEVEAKLPIERINFCKNKVYNLNKYQLKETNTRNVLLCGRTRSGKSTCVSLLKDPCYSPTQNSIFSDTVDAKFQSFSIENNELSSNNYFTINIIDTPGLFEEKKLPEERRMNEEIQKVISQCLENEVTNIHTLLIFTAFEQGINPHDLESMKIFLKMFSNQKLKIGLVLSRADNHNLEWRENIKKEILEHHVISELLKQHTIEVLFVGCVDLQSGRYSTEELLLNGYKSIYSMRKKLLDTIFQSENRVSLHDLPISEEPIKNVKQLMENLQANFGYFASVNDFLLSGIQQKLIQHEELLEKFGEIKGYVRIPAIAKELNLFYISLHDCNNKLKERKLDSLTMQRISSLSIDIVVTSTISCS